MEDQTDRGDDVVCVAIVVRASLIGLDTVATQREVFSVGKAASGSRGGKVCLVLARG